MMVHCLRISHITRCEKGSTHEESNAGLSVTCNIEVGTTFADNGVGQVRDVSVLTVLPQGGLDLWVPVSRHMLYATS